MEITESLHKLYSTTIPSSAFLTIHNKFDPIVAASSSSLGIVPPRDSKDLPITSCDKKYPFFQFCPDTHNFQLICSIYTTNKVCVQSIYWYSWSSELEAIQALDLPEIVQPLVMQGGGNLVIPAVGLLHYPAHVNFHLGSQRSQLSIGIIQG